MRKLIVLVIILIIILGVWSYASQNVPALRNFLSTQRQEPLIKPDQNVRVVPEESLIIDVVKTTGPSVVTIAADVPQQSLFENDPFFEFFGQQQAPESDEPQNIGSGFIVSNEGIIVTNKHVVSDRNVKYTVVTTHEKRYDVERIYRDPLNDIALLKISANNDPDLKPITLGDSDNLQVGQLVIAIGTALGEFNNTVTTGVISGLGRGVTAGSFYEGYVEQLDNVIQTDAAINPGNSGGPLLNSSGQVIGINTAVSQSGQNIGFALPINTVKESLRNFNETGQFNRPYLGIAYRMISRDLAIRNDLTEGAYVQNVVEGSAAAQAGIQEGDVITHIDGKKLEVEKNELAQAISQKKVGDTIQLRLWRENIVVNAEATLETAPEE
jgi:serine protease Do